MAERGGGHTVMEGLGDQGSVYCFPCMSSPPDIKFLSLPLGIFLTHMSFSFCLYLSLSLSLTIILVLSLSFYLSDPVCLSLSHRAQADLRKLLQKVLPAFQALPETIPP